MPAFQASTAALDVSSAQSASKLLLWLNHMTAKIFGNSSGSTLNMSVIHSALLPPDSVHDVSAMNIGLSMIRDTMTYWIVLSICEVATVLIEALLIHLIMKFSFKHTLLFALIANAASFLVGFLLTLTPVYEIQMAMIILCIVFGLVYLFTYGFILVSFIKANNNAF